MSGARFSRWALTAAVLAAAGCGMKINQLAPNLWVAEGQPPAPNSGIVATPFGAVVIDGQPGTGAAEGLSRTAEKLAKWEVAYLFMTGHRIDHSLGNEAFRKAEIVSTAACRRAMEERFDAERELLAGALRMSGLKSATASPATLTFEKALTLHAGWPKGQAVEIRVLEMPAGASPGNAVVYLPAEKTLFAGDLVTNRVFPYMGDADVKEWVRALEELDKFDAQHVVPGHGASGGKELIRATRRLLADLCAAVREAKASGKPPEESRKTFALPGYDKWPAYRELLPFALKRLWDQELPEIVLPPEPKAEPKAEAKPAPEAEPKPEKAEPPPAAPKKEPRRKATKQEAADKAEPEPKPAPEAAGAP